MMRVLHAWNQHRGGGGANNTTRATIDLGVGHGLEVEVFSRSSLEIPETLAGRFQAGIGFAFPGRNAAAFGEAIDRFRPDLVHAHEIFPLIGPWALSACRSRGVPVVMSCLDYRLTCPVATHYRPSSVCTRCAGGREYRALLNDCRGNVTESFAFSLYAFMLGQPGFAGTVEQFITPSEFTRRWFLEHRELDPDRVTAISPAVTLPERAADPAAGSWIGYAGRFTPEKGVPVFLEAARRSGVPVRLARSVQSLVTSTVPAELEVLTQNRQDLEQFYRGARAIVAPSQWFETFGLVAAEAMSHGIPVIVSRGGALEELVSDGVDGLTFDPGDVQALAEAMTKLWEDPELARSMGNAGRKKARERWGPEIHLERTLQVYSRACEDGAGLERRQP